MLHVVVPPLVPPRWIYIIFKLVYSTFDAADPRLTQLEIEASQLSPLLCQHILAAYLQIFSELSGSWIVPFENPLIASAVQVYVVSIQT